MTEVVLQGDAALEQKRISAKRKLAKQKLVNNSPSYGTLPSTGDTEKIMFNNGESSDAPFGTSNKFSEIQSDAVFDTPSTAFEEAGATFEKQAAYVALIANAYGLVEDNDIGDFVADRSRALASAQQRQPEYMKEFTREFEEANGFFEATGVILNSPRAIGRQVITQAGNSAIPLLTTAGGAGAGTAAFPGIGTVAGGVTGAFVGGSIVEIGAEIDGMLQEAGVDITNSNSIVQALSNDEMMDSIRSKAEKKGLTTAAVDALFQVVGGRFLKAAKIKGAGKVGTAVAGATDVGIQSIGEGVGEAAGQFAKDGEVNFKEAALEAITSLGQSVGQTAIGATAQQAPKTVEIVKQKIAETQSKIEAVEAKEVVSTADIYVAASDIDAAERDIASAIAENQIAEIQNEQQLEIISEAENIKKKIDATPVAERTDAQAKKQDREGVIKVPKKPETLAVFLKARGGLELSSGEARTLTNKEAPRLKGVANRNGKLTLDDAREMAEESGFIKEGSTIVDLMEALDNEASGIDVFSRNDFEDAANREAIIKFNDQQIISNQEKALKLPDELSERGLTRNSSVEDIVNVIREEKNLGTFTPSKLVEAKPISEIEGVDSQFEKDVKAIKVNNYGLISGALLNTRTFISDFGLGLERLLTPVSTRVKNISAPLFLRLRKFEFDVKSNTIADNQAIKPFLSKLKTLDTDTSIALDFAMKNGNKEVINSIAKDNNMVEEIAEVNKTLDDIFSRADAAGMDIQYRSDFFPRRVKDVGALIDHFKGGPHWNVIQEAIDAKEAKADKPLTNEERVSVINNLLRGFKVEGVSLAQKGVFKDRTIQMITPEIDKFYEKSDQALLTYIAIANDAIETNRLFGKKDGKAIVADIDSNINLDDSIGTFVNELSVKEEISTREAGILKEILNARFNNGHMGWITSAVRDVSYIDVMGSPLNAITQFGDLATSMYNSGIMNTVTSIPSAVTEKGRIDLDSLGIDSISEEFRKGTFTSDAVNKVFKATGLAKIDRVGKLTLVNSTLKKAQKEAKSGDKKLLKTLETMFGEDAPQVMKDLEAGNVTDDVRFFAFNTLLDMQPLAKSEMPEYYLRSGNLRLLYMLKTFTLRQLDIYRREVFSNINKAARTRDAKLGAKAIGNFVRLAGFWITMGASADYMKDLLRSAFGGDETEEPEDYVVDNIFKAFGFSRYQADMISRQGPVKVMTDLFLPPFKFFNNLFSDFKKLDKEELDVDTSRAIRSIPVGGELYYFWFGGGSGKSKSSRKSKSDLKR